MDCSHITQTVQIFPQIEMETINFGVLHLFFKHLYLSCVFKVSQVWILPKKEIKAISKSLMNFCFQKNMKTLVRFHVCFPHWSSHSHRILTEEEKKSFLRMPWKMRIARCIEWMLLTVLYHDKKHIWDLSNVLKNGMRKKKILWYFVRHFRIKENDRN